MRVLFSGYRDYNHSSAGGYDKIIGYPGGDYISDRDVPLGFLPLGKRGKGLNLLFLDIYTHILRRKYDIIHLFYGDTIILPYYKSRSHKVVATVHLSIADKQNHHANFINVLKCLDGVIVLSSQQEKILKEEYNIEAKFIPHGFLKPIFDLISFPEFEDVFSANKINVFYSGSNYRDVKLFIETVVYCNHHHLNIFFHVVGQKENIEQQLRHLDNVACYRRLSDNEYFSVLSLCDYNYLPLTFATANNALLEAQFLGVRGIYPYIAGIEDYAAPEPLNLFYKTKQELFSIFENISKVENSSLLLMEYSKKFLWENVYNKLSDYYKGLFLHY
jgi:glycosyltransferase involved in cell wall biosynthesis